MTPAVKCWHTARVTEAGERLAELLKNAELSHREAARRINAARGTIDRAVATGKPPRDRQQYRRLVDLIGEDPFVPRVQLNDTPAVPLDQLPAEQVIDLLAQLLRDPDFATALAARLDPRQVPPFGILNDEQAAAAHSDRADGETSETGGSAVQA